ncbi:MAG: hypothetical protein HUJ76_00520, partial [Parasporobacterium sp.]|nr:hypothetical protein [Parasporobacterium sp.]
MKKAVRCLIEILLIAVVFCAVFFPLTEFVKHETFKGYHDYMMGCADRIRGIFEVESEMLHTIEKTGKDLFETKLRDSEQEKDEKTVAEKISEYSAENDQEDLIIINNDNICFIVDKDGIPTAWDSEKLSESQAKQIIQYINKDAVRSVVRDKINLPNGEAVNADYFKLSDNSYFVKICSEESGKVSFNYRSLFSRLLTAEKSDADSFDIVCVNDSGSGEFDSDNFYVWNKRDANGEIEADADVKGLILQDKWYGQCTVNGTQCTAAVSISEEGLCFVHIETDQNMISYIYTLILLIALASLGFSLAIRQFARNTAVRNREQGIHNRQKRLSFVGFDLTVSSRTLPIVLFGVAILMVFTILVQSLTGNLELIDRNNSKIESIKNINSANRGLQKELYEQINSKVFSEIDTVERLFRERPDLINQENLQGISKTMGFEYIMVFDQWGLLQCTDSPYRSLRIDEISADQELAALMQGIEPVTAESTISGPAEKRGTSTESQILFGKSMRDKDDNLTGALVVCIKEEFLNEADVMSMIVSAVSGSDTESMIIDQESNTIEYSTIDSLSGVKALEGGMKEEQLVAGYHGPLNIKGTNSIASSGSIENKLVFFASNYSVDWVSGLIIVLLLSIFLLISFFQLIFIPKSEVREEEEQEQEQTTNHRTGRKHYSIDEYLFGSIIEETHRERQARKIKASRRTKLQTGIRSLTGRDILSVFFIVLILLAYVFFFSGAEYVFLIGQWAKSVNIISISHCVVLLTMVMVVAIILRTVLLVISHMVNQRGMTVCHLIRSCISYAAGIVGLLLCLETLGVDTG